MSFFKLHVIIFVLNFCFFIQSSEENNIIHLQDLPIHIIKNISSFLPKTEQSKLYFLSKSFFEEMYFASESDRIKAFKNYMQYPYLSEFYDRIYMSDIPAMKDDTTDKINILKMVLNKQSRKENNILFKQMLLGTSCSEYFILQDWIKFFKLKQKISKITTINDMILPEKSLYVRTTVFEHAGNTKIVNKKNLTNKVCIIRISKKLLANISNKRIQFSFDDIASSIIKKMKINKTDKIRVLFQNTGDVSNKHIVSDSNNLVILGQYLINEIQILNSKCELLSNQKSALEENILKNIFKIFDFTFCKQLDEELINNELLSKITIFANLQKNIFTKKMDQRIFTNVIFCPYNSQIDDSFVHDCSFLELTMLCQEGFALKLISRTKDKAKMNIIESYLSLNTRDSDQKIIVDYIEEL